ncbi:hypothetical protein [Donghicola mangrovi]|uniref:Uncharacterized protein n=1 Tax=Donghicola mangrovi TaxID=2729614 RepID=A0A850QEP1_9RHOB|nr:hypothetical protein [Donghicola mangrovi]NVO24321.1 hypothetical protein [Donghicola mangrovi]
MKLLLSEIKLSPLDKFSDATLEGIVAFSNKCNSTSKIFRNAVTAEANLAADILHQRAKAMQNALAVVPA